MPENFTAFLATHQWVIVLAAVWTIPWKGAALWRAARNQSVAWFVALLVINTLGILDIVYIFAFSKKAETPKSEKIISDTKKEEAKPNLDEEIQKG